MIPQAQGQPNLAASGVQWIPEVTSRMWNAALLPRLLINRLTTYAYFDELDFGHSVIIPDDPTVTFVNVANGADIPEQKVTPSSSTITIDRQGGFKVKLTLADRKMSPLDLARRYQKRGLQAADQFMETEFFAWLLDKAATENKGATAGIKFGGYDLGTVGAGMEIKGSNVVEYMLRIVSCAREQNDNDDINVVIPYWAYAKMFLSSTSNAQVMGDGRSQLRDGEVKPVNGMNFWWSNMTTDSDTNGSTAAKSSPVFALSKRAVAFTNKIKEVYTWRDGNANDFLVALMIWGYGLIKSKCIVQGYIYAGSES